MKSQRKLMDWRMPGQLEKPLTTIVQQVSFSESAWLAVPRRAQTYGHCSASLWDPAHCSESANVQTCLLQTRLDIGSTYCFSAARASPWTWLSKWVIQLETLSALMRQFGSGLSENAKNCGHLLTSQLWRIVCDEITRLQEPCNKACSTESRLEIDPFWRISETSFYGRL